MLLCCCPVLPPLDAGSAGPLTALVEAATPRMRISAWPTAPCCSAAAWPCRCCTNQQRALKYLSQSHSVCNGIECICSEAGSAIHCFWRVCLCAIHTELHRLAHHCNYCHPTAQLMFTCSASLLWRSMVLRALLVGILNADSSREGVLTCPHPCRDRPGEMWLGTGLGSGLPMDASVAAYSCRRVACTCYEMLLHEEVSARLCRSSSWHWCSTQL